VIQAETHTRWGAVAGSKAELRRRLAPHSQKSGGANERGRIGGRAHFGARRPGAALDEAVAPGEIRGRGAVLHESQVHPRSARGGERGVECSAFGSGPAGRKWRGASRLKPLLLRGGVWAIPSRGDAGGDRPGAGAGPGQRTNASSISFACSRRRDAGVAGARRSGVGGQRRFRGFRLRRSPARRSAAVGPPACPALPAPGHARLAGRSTVRSNGRFSSRRVPLQFAAQPCGLCAASIQGCNIPLPLRQGCPYVVPPVAA